ncbi:T9SS sorting signal type C domain-containing protein [Flavobacterium sp. MAHUQ-51]|uniref:T9SS sorting signal type C domain-containing protein n=1 Tax=Flavobacterium sp. GCM10022190 TaxID=3252639 RepID=UPI0036126544
MRPIYTFRNFIFLFVFLFFSIATFSQTTGDYRSNTTSGNWTTLSSWQYYNGSEWVTPTSVQGYPGQISTPAKPATGAVLIQAGHTIAMGTSSLSTSSMGSLTINGTLNLSAGSSGATFNINTPLLIVTPGLTPYAQINFDNKVTLSLPANVSMQVSTGGLPSPGDGTCTANIQITIGSTPYAYCTGNGQATHFEDIMANGGYNILDVVTATSVCNSGTSTISASVKPTPTTSTTYNLYSSSTGGTVLSSITSTVSPYSTSSLLTPSVNSTTTFYVEAVTGTRTTARKAVTVIVNNPSIPVLSTVSQPTCEVANGSFTITNYNPSCTYSVSPSFGVSISNDIVTAPAGTYTVTATSGGCSSVASNSVIVNPQPTVPAAPIISNIVQPNCTTETGSVVLSGLPSGSWTLEQSGTSSNTIVGLGTSTTISGLIDGGNYTFKVSNGTCTSPSSSVVNIDNLSTITSTWNGSAWINGVPDESKRIVFAGDYSLAENVVGCSCRVSSGNVIIKSGYTLKVTNSVIVLPNASLTFENNASLVQINDAAENTGNINYHRHTAAVRRYDYTYWSSPVAPQTLKNLSPNTFFDKYFSYDNGWRVIKYGAEEMVQGKGYIIRAPQSFSLTVAAVDTNPVFVGVPNNGEYPIPVVTNQTYLLGNPYPSAIDANAFLDANAANLEGTLYFWTHNTSPSNTIPGDATYNYTTNDYLVYNRTGGVVTNNASKTFDGKIAAGQGFFAPAKASGNVVFNNSMRVEGGASGANNSQFFKLSATTKTSVSTVEKSRIWLNLSNKQGAFKQMLVGYIKGATNDYDSGYDGVTYDGNQYVDFYSVNQASKYVIQGRALPFVKQDTVVLGYKSTIVGEFQINIDHADGVLETQNVFLEDKTLNVLHNLKNGSYTFTTEKGVFNDRFVLRYVDKNAVEEVAETPTPNDGISNGGNEISSSIVIYSKDKLITVKSPEVDVQKIVVYDSTGKLLYANENVAVAEFTITQQLASDQVLLVDVLLANGTKVSRKVIY